MSQAFKVSVIGAGVISHTYLSTIRRSPNLELRWVCSKSNLSAQKQAGLYGGTAASLSEILADAETDIVVNLAPPDTHYEIGAAVLKAGKHLYSEKPLATQLNQASELLALAADRGLLIGCAPDTFLGPAHQAARRALDAGLIGEVVGGSVAVQSHGMESWHPNPGAFYQHGGGPLLDVAPYHVTALVHLLGPVAEVCGFATRPSNVRHYRDVADQPATIAVDVPTTVNGALLFHNGANVAFSASWDVWKHRRSPVELYGETGALATADPNNFTGGVEISTEGGEWEPYEGHVRPPSSSIGIKQIRQIMALFNSGIDPSTGLALGSTDNPPMGDLRGLGLVDLATAIAEKRAPRASGTLALHVLEVLLALETASRERRSIPIRSQVTRP
jgi:predicted dehydrogenase